MNWIPKEITGLKIYSTEPDGNCFFKSIQIILQSIGITKSISYLRQVVATPVLDPTDHITNETIKNWIYLYQSAMKEGDYQLLEEYKHMRGVPTNSSYVNDDQRLILYKNMMTPEYWGEQHACRIIEEQTQMRFLIFNGDTKHPQLTWYQSSHFKPTHFCFLYLTRQHYMPVSWQGKFIFKWEELSFDIQKFFSEAYKPIKKT